IIKRILTQSNPKDPELEAIKTITQEIWTIFQENKIVKWRNDYIGHGALGNVEKGNFKQMLHSYLQVIENFFQQEKVQHAFQRLKYEVKNDGVEIQLMAKKPLLEKAYFNKEANQ